MKKILGIAALAITAFASSAQAQSCQDSWGYVADGGFEANAPEAFSPCTDGGSVSLLCIGPALLVTYSPAEGTIANDPNGNEHWPITMRVGDFVYSDYVNFMGATGEFGFVRVAWDYEHPLFAALQSGSKIEVSLPDFNAQSSVSLSGSRAAISQVIEACQSY